MTKKEKLKKLDEAILDKMITIMESNDDDQLVMLRDLATPMNYLRNNSVLADKEKSTVENDTKKRLAEAKARRKKNESE